MVSHRSAVGARRDGPILKTDADRTDLIKFITPANHSIILRSDRITDLPTNTSRNAHMDSKPAYYRFDGPWRSIPASWKRSPAPTCEPIAEIVHVIDDHQGVRDYVSRALSNQGYE